MDADSGNAHPVETYSHLVDRIQPLKLAYLHVATFKPEPDYHALRYSMRNCIVAASALIFINHDVRTNTMINDLVKTGGCVSVPCVSLAHPKEYDDGRCPHT